MRPWRTAAARETWCSFRRRISGEASSSRRPALFV